MARFRVESVRDVASGLYYNELFYPDDSVIPVASTRPIYRTLEDAERGAVELLKKALPEQPITVIDPIAKE